MHISQDCAQCGTETRCRRRDFNPQTWSVLLAWGEVEKQAIDQPICDECYNDLRDILIDRADEVAVALAQPQTLNSSETSEPAASNQASGKAPAAKTKSGKKAKKGTSKVA